MKKYLIFLSLMFLVSCNFAPGSYPYAEIYTIEVGYNNLIQAVEEFKRTHPEYIVPDSVGLYDGKSDRPDDHWYHIYFYNKTQNKILYTWVRTSDEGCSFAFVAVNDGLKLGNWKYINKDFSSKENRLEKQYFETEILNYIRQSLYN
ncbi:hypothetical protein GN157_12365 [Flavobacterium rakeshii]|uniref:Lipoprotein n=1 Tax=Flavobacterium rakeshii TaxID=1038845 RepID=A0A6N8HFK2_9FLAO|nr:hypothetical protein [Flavobacterium rakeshii]MEE1900094.1 hypothetical protein [Flavobacterium rakeshii]MUV04504.1 hypothetical protein [Flavobacterium rakeshii]